MRSSRNRPSWPARPLLRSTRPWLAFAPTRSCRSGWFTTPAFRPLFRRRLCRPKSLRLPRPPPLLCPPPPPPPRPPRPFPPSPLVSPLGEAAVIAALRCRRLRLWLRRVNGVVAIQPFLGRIVDVLAGLHLLGAR